MRIIVRGRHGRHRRSFPFTAHCAGCAPEQALELATLLADCSRGTFGPMVWRYGTITIQPEAGGKPLVVRSERPLLRLVKD